MLVVLKILLACHSSEVRVKGVAPPSPSRPPPGRGRGPTAAWACARLGGPPDAVASLAGALAPLLAGRRDFTRCWPESGSNESNILSAKNLIAKQRARRTGWDFGGHPLSRVSLTLSPPCRKPSEPPPQWTIGPARARGRRRRATAGRRTARWWPGPSPPQGCGTPPPSAPSPVPWRLPPSLSPRGSSLPAAAARPLPPPLPGTPDEFKQEVFTARFATSLVGSQIDFCVSENPLLCAVFPQRARLPGLGVLLASTLCRRCWHQGAIGVGLCPRTGGPPAPRRRPRRGVGVGGAGGLGVPGDGGGPRGTGHRPRGPRPLRGAGGGRPPRPLPAGPSATGRATQTTPHMRAACVSVSVPFSIGRRPARKIDTMRPPMIRLWR